MLVDTEQKLAELLEFINANETLAYDTETTGLNTRKDIIMGFGISNANSGFYVPLFSYSSALDDILPVGLGPELIGTIFAALKRKRLLMFNASFDARVTKYNLGYDLLPALHADVLLLKHTCDEEFPFGLKEIAAKLWGQDVKKEKEEMQESIKANGGTVKQYYKADVSLLSKYCIQDCLLTYRIYNHYQRSLEQQGLDRFYYTDEVLPLYKLVTIPMEEQGITLNMPKLHETIAEINKAIIRIEQGIQDAIMPHLGAVFTPWFLNKDYPLVTHKGNITLLGRRFKDDPRGASPEFYQAWSWRRDNPDNSVYMFNLQSKHHLKKLFFDTLKETPLSRTPTGMPQVDETFLEGMAQKYTWAASLIEFNKLQKIKGTYLERFLQEQENGIYYPSFQQHRTISGRLAGDMQQLPRTLGAAEASKDVVYFTNIIRELIVPRSGNVLVSADYEQLEPTIFAHTSGDPALQRIFNEGTDFYSTVAISTERLTGVSADKSAPNYLGNTNKAARQKAKAYALGIAYGMTGYKLKFELECSEEEASGLINAYFTAFPKLKEWINESHNTAKTIGTIKTETGRVRHLYQVKTLFAKYGECIGNDLELWKRYNHMPGLYEVAKAERRTFKNELNNAVNFQVQGLAASIVNRAAIKLAHLGYVPIMQVHDELVYEVPEVAAEESGSDIREVMENIIKLTVPLRTIPQYGISYKQCK